MPGYVITQYTVRNPKTYAQYAPLAGPALAVYGGKVLVVSHAPEVLEGKPYAVTVVLEFASVETARRWYTSPEYAKAKQLRLASTEGWLIIVPEFVMPAT
ncbi:MAG: DUF1330 domain-containing protein [Chloroflexi bacterium]|nr:DUF1330 domain-containing protein [Chloroflexota bacterium]